MYLLFKDPLPTQIDDVIEVAIKGTYFTANLMLICDARSLLKESAMNSGYVHLIFNCIYLFSFICWNTYVEWTERIFSTRSLDQVPKNLTLNRPKLPIHAVMWMRITKFSSCNSYTIEIRRGIKVGRLIFSCFFNFVQD